ncbi:MAG: DUF1579 family protein [Planctomycetota bacterium]|jgi:hypothetical protein
MQRAVGLTLIIGALAASFALGRVYAQEAGGADMEAMHKAWMELGKPGPEHAEFAKMAGDWSVAVKEFKPDGTTKVSKATTKFSMVLGGLIQRQDYKGEMGGTPFNSIGMTAFNKGTKKYESIWMDSMSSGMMWMNGNKIDDGKTVEYKGHFFGPGGAKMKTRTNLTPEGDDKISFVMWMDMGQGEVKSLEMVYTRVKK